MRQASQETDLSRADQMLQTSHISLSRVAANGAASAPQRGCRVGGPAPPGAEASAVTSAFRRAPDGAVRGQAPPRLMLRAQGRSRAPDKSSQFLTWCSAMASRELLTTTDATPLERKGCEGATKNLLLCVLCGLSVQS